MRYRNMGKWGLKISEVSLGSWMTKVGQEADVALAKESVCRAYDLGVNFFDCADAYSSGAAEVFLGTVLQEFPRHSYIVSSKVYFPVGPGVNDRGLSRKHIMEQCDKSLKNLQVDYLDLYFAHRYDTSTPVEETMQALSDLVAAGKVLYYGVSEWSAVQIEEGIRAAKQLNLRPMSVLQPQYNMVDRYIENEIMDICRNHGMGIVAFSPLSQGLLTGKYRKNQPIPEGSRATHQSDRQINDLLTDDNLDKVEKLIAIAANLGTNLSVLALAWALRRCEISSLIVGASKPNQIENSVLASGFEIPEDAMLEIEGILDYHYMPRKIG